MVMMISWVMLLGGVLGVGMLRVKDERYVLGLGTGGGGGGVFGGVFDLVLPILANNTRRGG